MSSVTVGELEALYHIDMCHADKQQRVAFGPLHLPTIRTLHASYDVADVWLAPSDEPTPPSYHQFTYRLAEVMDAGSKVAAT